MPRLEERDSHLRRFSARNRSSRTRTSSGSAAPVLSRTMRGVSLYERRKATQWGQPAKCSSRALCQIGPLEQFVGARRALVVEVGEQARLVELREEALGRFGRAAAGRSLAHQRRVGGDAIEPGPEARLAAEGVDLAPDLEKGL